MDQHFAERQHLAFKFFLGGAGLLMVFLFARVRTHADVTTPDNPNNNAPTATITSIVQTQSSQSVTEESPLTLTAGGTVPVRVSGTFVDADGCSQVETGGRIDALLQRGSVTTCVTDGFAQNDGGNSCYAVQGCTITSCSGTTANFQCDFNVAYNADATDLGTYSGEHWTAFVAPMDETMLNSGSNDSTSPGYAAANFEVALSPGIGGGGDVTFGAVDLGSVSPEAVVRIVDEGNTPIGNVSLLMSSLLCRHNNSEEPGYTGTIAATSVYESDTPSSSLESMTPLSPDTPVTVPLDIPVATTTMASSSRPVYLRVQTPSSLIAGVCSGTLTVGIE